MAIGPQCGNPFECDYCDHCWKHVPDYSVYDVASGKKLEMLLLNGILDVKNIPDDFVLGDKKRLDVDSYNKNKVVVDKAAIKSWLDKLEYPLYFLD